MKRNHIMIRNLIRAAFVAAGLIVAFAAVSSGHDASDRLDRSQRHLDGQWNCCGADVYGGR